MCDRCRFARRVQFTPTCWLWTGSQYRHRGSKTYGQIMVKGERTGAHRWAYRLWKGDIPDGLEILHSCDVKECVNPDHLRVGTHAENIQEALAKRPGHYAGERNGRARLTWDDVRDIRAARGAIKATELARRYGVSDVQIRLIWRGVKWPEPKRETQREVA